MSTTIITISEESVFPFLTPHVLPMHYKLELSTVSNLTSDLKRISKSIRNTGGTTLVMIDSTIVIPPPTYTYMLEKYNMALVLVCDIRVNTGVVPATYIALSPICNCQPVRTNIFTGHPVDELVATTLSRKVDVGVKHAGVLVLHSGIPTGLLFERRAWHTFKHMPERKFSLNTLSYIMAHRKVVTEKTLLVYLDGIIPPDPQIQEFLSALGVLVVTDPTVIKQEINGHLYILDTDGHRVYLGTNPNSVK